MTGVHQPRPVAGPRTSVRQTVASHFLHFTTQHGSAEVLTKLALGKVEACPYPEDPIHRLRQDIVTELSQISWRPGARGLFN